ncbi:MAG: PLP-dependent aminotransferase family protein [Telmatospirillum sp.]|nr:PLP-dependent aminotransferase family protein [Telmatospirillum sp.]
MDRTAAEQTGLLSKEVLLYEETAAVIGRLIEQGVYRPGDRIPSIRALSRQRRVSVNTVMEAYARLENSGLIEARPHSGHYVRSRFPEPENTAGHGCDDLTARPVTFKEQIVRIRRDLSGPAQVPLGRGGPNPDLLPATRLNRILASQLRRFPRESISYASPRGMAPLRVQIARRSLSAGCALSPDDIVVTSGCVEAVTLALQATCRPGDTVAVGSPVYYTFLNSIQWMGLKVLEIPSSPREGMNLDVLAYALKQQPVHACLILATFNNPLGGLMPDEKKRELVGLLTRHEIPLIEDDVYGDLGFAPQRPPACKAYDETGLVLLCSSFSKTLAPGYRVGWIAPGRFLPGIETLKSLFNIATPSPTQLAVAEFLTNGGYDHHLRSLRGAYSRQTTLMRDAVGRYFPAGTRVTRPDGGSVLWVEMPENVEALALYERASKQGITVAPGPLFTMGEQYRNCLRLNAAFWSERIEATIRVLGEFAHAR